MIFFGFGISERIENALSSFVWGPLSIKKANINRVLVTKDRLYASVIDSTYGPLLVYSQDEGKSWKGVPTLGNNHAIAITNDGQVLCGVGTKIFCVYFNQIKEINFQLIPVSISGMALDIQPYGKRGVAMIGMFQVPFTNEVVNGVAYNSYIGVPGWEFKDFQLRKEDGYVAMGGSFPTEETWFIISGSWPTPSDRAQGFLSGRLNIITENDLNQLADYRYELISLRTFDKLSFHGAISKTTDRGKTWKKVFDSKKQFYFNQIHCLNENRCVAVGEGSLSTFVLLTTNSGNSWDVVFRSDSQYSLRTCRMIGEEEIWVAGGMLVEARNGSSIHFNNSKGEFFDNFLNLDGIYYHSKDGGLTWTLTKTAGYVYNIDFLDEHTGYAATIHRDHCEITKLFT